MASLSFSYTFRAILAMFFSTILLLLVFPASSVSQVTFERNYGGTEDDIGRCVRQTIDNGYIICGYTKSFGAVNYDAYVIRTDELGDTIWTKSLGGPGFDAAYSLVITSDNGYLVCGTYLDPNKAHSDIWLVRLNADGDTLWTRHNYSTTNAAAYSVQLTSSDGFIITGTREDATGTGHMFLLETDADGDQLWAQDYPFWSTSGGNAVVTTNDDGFLICGYIDIYNPSWNRNLGMVKANNQGDTLWTRQFGGSAYEMGWSVCESASGGYLAAGYTTGFGAITGDAYIVKTTDQGVMEWQTHFGKTGLDIVYDITNTDDLSYIATGISGEQGSEFQEAWLFKMDQSGDTIWSHSYGGYRKSYGYSVMQTTDAGYVFCGSTNASGTNVYDVMLVKTTSDGLITTIGNQPEGEPEVRVFPNPTEGLVTLELPLRSERIVITSLAGKILLDNPVSEHQKLTLNLHGLASGLYLLKVIYNENTLVEKLVIR
ncbi:MAG: T9SS type A sorting domain-containing protein [Bacteroidia bacterium]|nr:T9SS type A sorting domain-containing protein [Bacteroidia bacterium]